MFSQEGRGAFQEWPQADSARVHCKLVSRPANLAAVPFHIEKVILMFFCFISNDFTHSRQSGHAYTVARERSTSICPATSCSTLSQKPTSRQNITSAVLPRLEPISILPSLFHLPGLFPFLLATLDFLWQSRNNKV